MESLDKIIPKFSKVFDAPERGDQLSMTKPAKVKMPPVKWLL